MHRVGRDCEQKSSSTEERRVLVSRHAFTSTVVDKGTKTMIDDMSTPLTRLGSPPVIICPETSVYTCTLVP